MNPKLSRPHTPGNMTLRATASVLAATFLACGCVIVPVTVEGFDPDCRVATYHMELQAVQLHAFDVCRGGQGCDAAVLISLGVTAASVIVSGSIVVAGNVVYWAEHRVSCPHDAVI